MNLFRAIILLSGLLVVSTSKSETRDVKPGIVESPFLTEEELKRVNKENEGPMARLKERLKRLEITDITPTRLVWLFEGFEKKWLGVFIAKDNKKKDSHVLCSLWLNLKQKDIGLYDFVLDDLKCGKLPLRFDWDQYRLPQVGIWRDLAGELLKLEKLKKHKRAKKE